MSTRRLSRCLAISLPRLSLKMRSIPMLESFDFLRAGRLWLRRQGWRCARPAVWYISGSLHWV